MRRGRQLAGLLAGLVVLMGGALLPAGCSGVTPREEPTPTRAPLPVVPAKPTYDVQRGEVVKTLEFRGRIVPSVEEELYFRTSGYVGTIYVERDEMVKAGDLQAELETTDLQNQLAQARADLEAIQLKAEQRLAEAQANLRIAELRLAQMAASDPHPQVVVAEIDVERAQTALADAQVEYDKAIHRYWDPDEVHEAYAGQLREAELDLREAEARYQQAYQTYHYGVQILEQEVALARLRLQEIEAGLDIQGVELAVRRLEDQLADARIVAPFDGQVASIRIGEGRAVEAYRAVMVIADPSDLEVKADLPGAEASKLARGMPAVVELATRPGEEVLGYVRRVPYGGSGASESETDGSVRVALETGSAGITFELGNIVRVTIELERKEDVLWLPPQAIRTFEGRDFVVVQEDGVQRRADVKIGLEAEDRVEIEEGLTVGQVVVGQ